jgi:hypothetical protein
MNALVRLGFFVGATAILVPATPCVTKAQRVNIEKQIVHILKWRAHWLNEHPVGRNVPSTVGYVLTNRTTIWRVVLPALNLGVDFSPPLQGRPSFAIRTFVEADERFTEPSSAGIGCLQLNTSTALPRGRGENKAMTIPAARIEPCDSASQVLCTFESRLSLEGLKRSRPWAGDSSNGRQLRSAVVSFLREQKFASARVVIPRYSELDPEVFVYIQDSRDTTDAGLARFVHDSPSSWKLSFFTYDSAKNDIGTLVAKVKDSAWLVFDYASE